MDYQDIHLEDKSLWDQIKVAWQSGNYQVVKTLLSDSTLIDKQLNATSLNDIMTEILRLENQGLLPFKDDKIKVAETPPTDLQDGEVYFKQLNKVTEYNDENAYYIEITQKNGNSYDLMCPRELSTNMILTNTTASIYGKEFGYTLDQAIYDAYSIISNM